MKSLPPAVHIYTDGSSYGNPGPAGSGFVVRNPKGKHVYFSSNHIGHTTNNRAELDGIKEALSFMRHPPIPIPAGPVFLFVDNRWAINTALGRTPAQHNEAEAKIVRHLAKAVARTRRIHIYWTPGHAGVEGNELADAAAKRGASGISGGSTTIQDRIGDLPTGQPEGPMQLAQSCVDCAKVAAQMETWHKRKRNVPKKSRPRPKLQHAYNTRARRRDQQTATADLECRPGAPVRPTVRDPIDQGPQIRTTAVSNRPSGSNRPTEGDPIDQGPRTLTTATSNRPRASNQPTEGVPIDQGPRTQIITTEASNRQNVRIDQGIDIPGANFPT